MPFSTTEHVAAHVTPASPAPTDLDTSSDDVEIVSVTDTRAELTNNATPISNLTPFDYWTQRIESFYIRVFQTQGDPRIHWCLNTDLTISANRPAQTAHANEFIAGRLAMGFEQGFKVGISHRPFERWCGPRVRGGYAALGFQELHVLVVHDNATFIMQCEKEVLKSWRRYNERGYRLTYDRESGHALCLNRLPGGENGSHGTAPFCLYVAIRSPAY